MLHIAVVNNRYFGKKRKAGQVYSNDSLEYFPGLQWFDVKGYKSTLK